MSEEEEKVIEILRTKIILLESGHNLKTTDEFSRLSLKRDIETILNLIEQLEKELEPIRELGIPVETAVAELNRLEDLEDDREQMQQIINELRKDSIPKSVIREKLEELEKAELFQKYSYENIRIAVDILKELLGGSNE